jgi:hypothetical protein
MQQLLFYLFLQQQSQTKRGEVKNTEGRKNPTTQTLLICFQEPNFESDDESVHIETSRGKVMGIATIVTTNAITNEKISIQSQSKLCLKKISRELLAKNC